MNINNINHHVSNKDAHIRLKIINDKIKSDIKNHCLKLDKTW